MFNKIKFTYDYIKTILKVNGFELLSTPEECEKSLIITYKDTKGYKYKMLFNSRMLKAKHRIVHSKNVFSIENINLYLKLNNIPIKLISNVYKNSSSKLSVKCKCGTEYETTWSSIQQGNGHQCKKCTYMKIAKTNTMSFEDVLKIFEEYGFIIIGGNYKKITSILKVIDDDGYKYITSAFYLSQGSKPCKFSPSNPFTIENIKLYLKKNGDTISLISKNYVDMDTHLIFKCSNCNENFKSTLSSIVTNNIKICKKCAYKIQGENNRLELNEIKERLFKIGLYILNEEDFTYKNVSQKLSLIDKEGFKYYMSMLQVKNKKCIKNNSTERVGRFEPSNPYSLLNIVNYIKLNELPCELLSNEYLNCKSRLKFRCLECNNVFETSLATFISMGKYRCDRCTHAQSNINWKTEEYLKDNKVEYIREYRINECKDIMPLPFDFAIINKNNDLKYLIEVDGEQHYKMTNMGKTDMTEEDMKLAFEKRIYHDNIKNEYCKNKNIKLIRLPYWYFRNDKYINILNKELKK